MTREFGRDALRPDRSSVVTVGTFDGVHVGHQAILRYLRERAAVVGGPATVVTFDPHPRTVLRSEPVPLLTTVEERADLLEAAGVERFVVLPFSHELAALEPEDYVQAVLLEEIGMREIVIGHDHRFGRARRGDEVLLRAMGARHGFAVDVIPAEVVGATCRKRPSFSGARTPSPAPSSGATSAGGPSATPRRTSARSPRTSSSRPGASTPSARRGRGGRAPR